MKKVININFQGRVIPIEEAAYENLTSYVESLRRYFATEEGRDEIINDIEGRIAELFGEILKKGSTCITEADVTSVINSMGRPEDFDAEETNVKSQLEGEKKTQDQHQYYNNSSAKKLYRDENHKVLGGVCSGIASYFGIDTVIVRILFLVFIGITFIPYLILWIAVPSSSSLLIGSQRKRLFRDPDFKMIAGVCSGLAQYFSVQVWIPRILFLIPFLSFVFRWGHWGWWDFPHFLSFSFSPGSIFVYIILWIVLPEAKSSADKLEMKGEKVDLNNIKSTIQSDLEGFKDRAQAFGSEIKGKAQEFSENIGNTSKQFTAQTAPFAKSAGKGVGHIIAVLVKVFVYFIVGSILLAIVAGLFGVGVALTGLLPAYSYVLDDGYQKFLSWGALILFIWVPVIAIVTWIIRKLSGKKGNRGIIRLTFLSLWILGLICFINLIVTIRNDFRYRNFPAEENITLANASVNKLEIKAVSFGKYYTGSWLRMEPFASFDDDTVYVRNVRLRIVKSTTDSFQVTMVKMANGKSKNRAEQIAANINYNIMQRDTLLMLDKGIAITREDKFRNQQVIVTIAVPVGKRILINDNVGWNNIERIDIGRDDDYWDWENNMESESLRWRHDVEYVMTTKGLERVSATKADEQVDNEEDNSSSSDAIDEFRKSREQMELERKNKLRELEQIEMELKKTADSAYRYTPPQQQPKPKTDARTALRAQARVAQDSFKIEDLLLSF